MESIKTFKKGFTLIELLIVIAILAILSTIVVVVLNPAELLRQARDSTRISELASLRSAISLYLASQNTGLPNTTTNQCASTLVTQTFCGPGSGTTSTDVTVASAGWVNVNFTLIAGGSPLATLPLDPRGNNATTFYRYFASSTNSVFELNANMESSRYTTGADDVEGTDGGDQATCYEVGTNINLMTTACPVPA